MLAERLDQQVRIVEKMYNINNRPKMLDIMGTGFLGKGGYGSAYSIIVKEIKKKGGDPFVSRAMKVCKKLKGNENEIEANLLRKVSHRNIIQLFYFNKIQGEMCLIINLMESDLFYYMKTEYEAGRKLGVYIPMFAHQLFCGLEYLDKKDIIHRDIKLENLLINSALGTLKIADFGCSTKYKRRAVYSPFVGTLTYMSPEQLMGSTSYCARVDMWASGIILSEFVLQRPIFEETRDISLLLFKIFCYLGLPSKADLKGMNVPCPIKQRRGVEANTESIRGRLRRAAKSDRDVVTEDYLDLVKKLLVMNPKYRLRAKDAVAHRYFKILKNVKAPPNGTSTGPVYV